MSGTTIRAAAGNATNALVGRSNLLRSAVRAIDRRAAPGDVRVLCYHGVTEHPLPVADPCFTTADRFAEQMRYLSEHFNVLHLEDAFDPDQQHPGPVACVTFDDGFAGTYRHAYPVLRELGIPATSFLVTDLLDTDSTVWFGSLQQAIIETTARDVVLAGERFSLAGADDRSRTSIALQSGLKALDDLEFAPAFEAVMGQLCTTIPVPSDDFRILTVDQVREMTTDDLVRIGGHSATHQILTRTTPDRAADEITRSVTAVRSLVDRPSDAFAYPNGATADYDDRCIDQLKELGITLAVTTMPGPNHLGDDRFHVRRIVVGADEGSGRFATRVHRLGQHLRQLGPG